MLVHDKFIFLHLPKCGGCFVKNFLKQTFPEECSLIKPPHRPISKKLKQDIGNRFIFGNIRNPFSYYVSLYFYRKQKGLLRKGGFHRDMFFEDFLYALFSSRPKYILTNRMHRVFQKDVQYICKLENLVPDLINCFEEFNFTLDKNAVSFLQTLPPFNTSEHDEIFSYYTEDLISLVEVNDREILERFNY